MGKCLELYDEMLNKKIDLKRRKDLYPLILLRQFPITSLTQEHGDQLMYILEVRNTNFRIGKKFKNG